MWLKLGAHVNSMTLGKLHHPMPLRLAFEWLAAQVLRLCWRTSWAWPCAPLGWATNGLGTAAGIRQLLTGVQRQVLLSVPVNQLHLELRYVGACAVALAEGWLHLRIQGCIARYNKLFVTLLQVLAAAEMHKSLVDSADAVARLVQAVADQIEPPAFRNYLYSFHGRQTKAGADGE